MTETPKLRWYQYSLRSLFVLMTLVACACSWYAYEMNEAAKRRVAIDKLIKLGADFSYYDARNPNTLGDPPEWYSVLRRIHGDEHLGNPAQVYYYKDRFTDAEMVPLEALTKLEALSMQRLRLKAGRIEETGCFDARLQKLKGLSNLKHLVFVNTRITDAGLEHLNGLARLESLALYDTQVTEEGVKKLQEALPNCEVYHGSMKLWTIPFHPKQGDGNL
jgi:hypothetical protein